MRPPAMIAKAAASLDVMSGGRFELGLGAGDVLGRGRRHGRAASAAPASAADALEEAIRMIRAALDVGPERAIVRGAGPHYPVPGYPPGPPPAHRVEIWVGAMAPRALDIIGRLADGWVPGGGISQIADVPPAEARIDRRGGGAGRDPSAIRRILNISGTITDGPRGEGPLEGPVDQWVDTLAGWAIDLGVDSFVLWPADTGTGQIERFAAEVVPAVRGQAVPR